MNVTKVDEILLARRFIDDLHVFLRVLCAMSRVPEKSFLAGVPQLKTLGDLMALLQQIQDAGEACGINWAGEPCLVKDENQEPLAIGFRVYVCDHREKLFFSLCQVEKKLSCQARTFTVSAHDGGVNNLSRETKQEIVAMPSYIKQALIAALCDMVFTQNEEGQAIAGAAVRWAKTGNILFLHNEVAHHIEDALDLVETLRGVSRENPDHLGAAWDIYIKYATPELQARFIAEDMAGTAPDVAVEATYGKRRIVTRLCFYLPLAQREMLKIIADREGLTVVLGSYTFEMPNRAKQATGAPPRLTPTQQQEYLQVLRAIKPGLSGQALALCREAIMYYATC